jgi:cell division protein FtsB
MQKKEHGVNDCQSKKILLAILIFCCGTLVSGCVVLEEKYNAEKARSLNFQRLLAQEERRTAELDNEVKRTKRELAEFEARNLELSAQVQSVREQMERLQEEAEAIKESVLLERKAMEDMREGSAPSAKPKMSGPPTDFLSDLAGTRIHVVRPGETLFRISRRYGIEIEKLKTMNKLPDDIIEVGQKLIVGTE